MKGYTKVKVEITKRFPERGDPEIKDKRQLSPALDPKDYFASGKRAFERFFGHKQPRR